MPNTLHAAPNAPIPPIPQGVWVTNEHGNIVWQSHR